MKTAYAVIFMSILVVFFFTAITTLHPMGYPVHAEMDDYFIKNAQIEVGANNVVTSIVFDYRGFDTLGEATVLFTAVISVVALLRGVKKDEE